MAKWDFETAIEFEELEKTDWFILSDEFIAFLKNKTKDEVKLFLEEQKDKNISRYIPLLKKTKDLFRRNHDRAIHLDADINHSYMLVRDRDKILVYKGRD